MRKYFCFALTLFIAVSAAKADLDPVKERQQILKGFGDATKPVVAILRGDAPFDAGKVEAALKLYVDGTRKLPSLYPEPPKPGEKTEALPAIWKDKAKFEAIYAKLGKEAEQAEGAGITDVASLKAQFPKILGNCKACHDDFRAKD